MSKKDIKELQCKFIELVEEQVNGDLSKVCTSELGEVMDMAKDCGELLMYIAKADYYEHVIEAMETSSTEKQMEYINKYDDSMEYARSRMYYSSTSDSEVDKAHQYYMNMKKTTTDVDKLASAVSHYSEVMLDDIDEALVGASAKEVEAVKTNLTNYVNSI